jgi:hypothetical protein
MKNRGFPLALIAACTAASAHEGHGQHGSHWHASDVFGFALLIGLAALAVWWRGRK